MKASSLIQNMEPEIDCTAIISFFKFKNKVLLGSK